MMSLLLQSLNLLLLTVVASGFLAKFDTQWGKNRNVPARSGSVHRSLVHHHHTHTKSSLCAGLSEADKERLFLSEKGLSAFIVAEMQHFVNQTMVELDQGIRYGTKWTMPDNEKLQMGLIDENGVIINDDYIQACQAMKGDDDDDGSGGAMAVDLICQTTKEAFQDGFREQGLLSALGSAILYFRNYYRTPKLIAACERVGLSDYDVAHHITDMYHHRSFRGAYTKTLAPSGKGEIAARIAVGLDKEDVKIKQKNKAKVSSSGAGNAQDKNMNDNEEEDECLVWSPTNPDVCIHWKSDDEKWRKTRFERIQMEGTKDPRRGGSGTTR